MDRIELHGVLPQVFSGSEPESGVWLHDIEFVRGGHYLVEAASGTGKSSLCSFVYGNRRDYEGRILFDGTDIRTLSIEDWCRLRCRSLGILPQEMRLFPELTVMENIRLKNSLTDFMSETEILALLAEMEIDHKANRPAAMLSIGQQQRAALVRALCQPLDFLLLDEPVSHLDALNNERAAAMVIREAGKQGAAVIVTSVGNHLAITDFITIKL
ncbi:MAG: ATP-binding cassette domain-containing protein [Muribaculaceae bacterium]|nr:ATP-binding cassette domain-containing protein [Muribaculaceae bacterium]